MSFCPNLADPDIAQEFSILKSQVGEETAYWYWDRFKGDYSAIQDTLTQRGVRVQSTPEVPKISLKTLPEGMSGKILAEGTITRVNLSEIEISDQHNANIWELEKQLGLVSIRTIKGKKWKFYNPMSVGESNKLRTWILHNHLGVKVGMVIPWSGKGIGLKVIGHPINVDQMISEHKTMLDRQVRRERGIMDEGLITPSAKSKDPEVTNNPVELKDIKDLTSRIGIGRLKGETVLDFIDDDADFNESDKSLMNLFKEAITKYPELGVQIISKEKVDPDHIKTYMYYDSTTDYINLVEESIHNPNNASYGHFVTSLLHEYVHAFTLKALFKPSTDEQKAFKKEMVKLYNLARKNTTQLEFYGYTDVAEFVAEVMVSETLQEDLKSLQYNWWQRFINSIKALLGFGVYDLNELQDNAFRKVVEFISTQESFDVTGVSAAMEISGAQKAFNEAEYPLKGSIDLSNRKESVELLRSIQGNFEFVPGRGRIHKKTDWTMFPVTSIMNQYNLGIDKEELKSNEELQAAVDRAGAIGSVVHGNIEQIFEGGTLDIKNKEGFTSTASLRADLTGILKQFKGQKVTVISELYVADHAKGIGGTIDMVVIDEKNRVHLYDFKSKEKGFDTWGKRYNNTYDGSLKYSSQQAAHAQLTIYKTIFEKITGLPVHDLSAVMITPSVKESKVTGAKLSGIESWNVNSNVGERIYKTMKNLAAKEKKFDDFLSSIPGLEDPTRSYFVESKLKTIKYQALEFSKLDTALNELINGLEGQLTYAKKTSSRTKIERLQKDLDRARDQAESLDSLKVILRTALIDTASINKRYFEMKKAKEKISVGQLFGWKRSVEAWDGFGDYATYLTDQIEMIDPEKHPKQKKMYEDIIASIDIVVKRSNQIKERYTKEGIEKLIDYLAPFYNRIRAEERNLLKKLYRRDKPKGVTEEEFVQKRLAEQEEDIDIRTKALLREEMRKASTDINVLGMWLDNLLDSRDPVTAAMVESFSRTEFDSHRESLDTRDRILKTLKPFEKKYSDRAGTVSYKKLYDFMTEKDENGKYTGHFVKRFRSSLFREYNDQGELVGGYMKVIKDTRHLEPEERDKQRREWKNNITTFNKENFARDKWVNIQGLFENQPFVEKITNIHLETLRAHESETLKAFYTGEETESLQDLANNGAIPVELADAIDDWIYKNAWEYRELRPQFRKKYHNPQWDALQLRKGPDVDLYNLMIELADEADSMLPYSSRLGGRLPGVRKRTREMVKENMGIVATVREGLKNDFAIMPDDTEHDNFSNEGEEKAFLPIHYTGKIDIENQSFDIPTIIFKYWQSSNDFNNKKEILPEMELAKYLIKNRKTDPINKKWLNIFNNKTREEVKANNNNLSRQVEEWFQMAVYGRPKKQQGKLMGINVVKLTDALNKYTSLNLLGLNVIQGTANAILGEAMQTAERIAGEYMSKSAYRKGTLFYARNLPGIMGDVGRRGSTNVVTKLMETFDVLDEWEGTNFTQRQKYRQAMKTDTLFWTTHAGEHEMQGRFMLSMLSDKRAIDDNGKDIGSMLQMYKVVDGKLIIDPRVNLKKSEWTKDDQFDFQYKVRGILSRLHGEYSDLGRMAIQRGALGRMAAMFRKFVIPGFKRRWASEAYVERLDDFVEGNYISTAKFAARLVKDLYHFKFSMAAQWGNLSDHEKANVRRTLTEVSFLLMAIILSNIAIAKLKEGDDEDERMWSFMAYQALRLRAELLFFIKPDETLSILRSPMASMSVAENLIRLSGQIFHPAELYERGPWKGEPKIKKTMTNMAPGYRQFYRVRDLRDQLSWFSSKIN